MIVLDTHVWIWLLSAPEELSPPARRLVEDAVGPFEGSPRGSGEPVRPRQLLISAISVWELFMLAKKGRLELTLPPAALVSVTNRDPRFDIIPVDESIARRSVELPDIHDDPADRMILATAVELGAPIVSKDGRFSQYDLVPVVW